jgi:retron-type reverse transcriptase
MMTFDSYFREKEILKILATYRAKLAKKKHDLQFLRNISSKAKNPNSLGNQIEDLFPPRENWIRLSKNERIGKNSFEINEREIFRSLLYYRHKFDSSNKPSWLINIEDYIAKLRMSALNKNGIRFSSPDIFPVEKNKDKKTFRPIALYSIKDRIIIGQTARYLIDIFDFDFLPNSYAFRSGKIYKPCPTHHSAVEKIIDYRNAHLSSNIFVAECDIKKFFDCVNHDIVIECLIKAINRSKQRDIIIDERAISLFLEYLISYSFSKDIITKDFTWFSNKGKKGGRFEWAEEDLKSFYENLYNEPIGVPQGGAISCLIANLLLDEADRKMMNISDPELFYARYCDDMIIMHIDKAICTNAFENYKETLFNLKLPIHTPQLIKHYDADFWEEKSKNPYLWTVSNTASTELCIPWISFVGYQVRYDGLLRVRKKSIEKELKKQIQETDKVLNVVRFKSKKILGMNEEHLMRSAKQIAFRHQQKLISMSVGRIILNTLSKEKTSFCWTAGFKLLRINNILLNQIKLLDRGRNRQIKRLINHLRNIKKTRVSIYKPTNVVSHYGYSFSYFYQFDPKRK